MIAGCGGGRGGRREARAGWGGAWGEDQNCRNRLQYKGVLFRGSLGVRNKKIVLIYPWLEHGPSSADTVNVDDLSISSAGIYLVVNGQQLWHGVPIIHEYDMKYYLC